MKSLAAPPYTATPCYPSAGRPVLSGWAALAASLSPAVTRVAIDGPAIAGWADLVPGLGEALDQRGFRVEFREMAGWLLPWPRIEALTSSYELRDDPDFDRLPPGRLADLVRAPSRLDVPPGSLLVVYGPGAALVPHDVLWYADLPKRYAEAAIAAGSGLNLGQPLGTGPGTTKRLFFIDWPLLDRQRDEIMPRIEFWIDMQDASSPAVIDGATLRATVAELAVRPFRTRPTFNTTPWGGHWGQRTLGQNLSSLNTALGYELIAPEAGVLIGTEGGPLVELPFQLAVTAHPVEILGERVHPVFGTSFPVRFDYLDTVDGGNLSVHCHPQHDYMSAVFGWPYTQHESYYVMVGGESQRIFLGLQENADLDAFYQEASEADRVGRPLDITRYVPTFPATPHQLFLIPGGTPHGSGAGNVVLEVSATPYLYSLRFYDWLRQGIDGGLRPVHVNHAFKNLDRSRRGDAVARELVQRPRLLRQGEGWHEELLGALPEMFFQVHRVALEPGAVADAETDGRFHVLNVVEGDGVLIEPAAAPEHSLVYAETLVVPAAVGHYAVRSLGRGPVRVVKALVP
jgi:mannose-6-phosphate isomerase class I